MSFISNLFSGRDDLRQTANKKENGPGPKPAYNNQDKNIHYIKQAFRETKDLTVLPVMGGNTVLVYLETLVDTDKMQEMILLSLQTNDLEPLKAIDRTGKPTKDLNEVVKGMLQGHVAVFSKDFEKIYLFNTTFNMNRSPDEPENEKIIRGSHEGFIENLAVNLSLIRRRIETTDLKILYKTIGTRTETKVAVVYMDSIANPDLVNEINFRLNNIEIDMMISPGYMEEYIQDSTLSPFPQTLNTERPDRVISYLMDGRIAVLSEGSPTCLILPVSFIAFYQSPDDYNSRWYSGTFNRTIRMLSFIIALGLPSFYISIIAFHFEVIPNELVLPVKASVQDIPYPPLIEALIMEITIELIREAGIRLPTPIGQTISIVGGLVIGDAVVKAGLISELMIIVVAITAISAYVVPSHELSTTVRLLRFPFMFLAAMLGFFGMAIGAIALFIHLCKLKSLGMPYFTPFAPLNWQGIKDTIVRLPLPQIKKRPKIAKSKNQRRAKNSRKWDRYE